MPWEAGRKALPLGMGCLLPHAPRTFHNRQFMDSEREKNYFLAAPLPGEPLILCPCILTVGAGAWQRGEPKFGLSPWPQGSTCHHSTELPWWGSKQELGAKAPLRRVHLCAHFGNPRAIYKRSTFSLKDEKNLGELEKLLVRH